MAELAKLQPQVKRLAGPEALLSKHDSHQLIQMISVWPVGDQAS